MELKCNDRVRAALDYLIERIRKDPDVIRLTLFGSQARGDAGESSDIDLSVVVDEGVDGLETCCEVRYMLDEKPDVVVDTPSMLKRYGRIRGRVEYYAIREGITLYERPDAEKLIGAIKEAEYDEQTRHWLDAADAKLKEVIENEMYPMYACKYAYESICFSIKAMLAHEHIDYGFTRNLEEMYGLLPNQSSHDLARVMKWRLTLGSLTTHKYKATRQDALDAIKMATKIYDETKNKCVMPEIVL